MLTTDVILQERYRIVRQLGHGGMGAVYEAQDKKRFDAPVALKEILVSLGDITDDKQQELLKIAFEREAKILTEVQHEVFPHVIEFFAEGDRQFLVMELIQGADLAELLSQSKSPFMLKEVLKWADQLLDALDYLHSHQPPIFHRDLKPQNLKLTPRGKIKLLDFGIAKSAESNLTSTITNQTFIAATLNYSPFEQILRVLDPVLLEVITQRYEDRINEILKRNADARSDLYALGATLYHLSTAIVPTDALKRTLETWADKDDPLEPPHKLNPEIPEEISQIILKSMEIDRENRFDSAVEMRTALNEAVAAIKKREEEARRKREEEEQLAIRLAEQEKLEKAQRLAEEERRRIEAEREKLEKERLEKERQLYEAEVQRQLAEQERLRIEAEKEELEKKRLQAEEKQRQIKANLLKLQQQHSSGGKPPATGYETFVSGITADEEELLAAAEPPAEQPETEKPAETAVEAEASTVETEATETAAKPGAETAVLESPETVVKAAEEEMAKTEAISESADDTAAGVPAATTPAIDGSTQGYLEDDLAALTDVSADQSGEEEIPADFGQEEKQEEKEAAAAGAPFGLYGGKAGDEDTGFKLSLAPSRNLLWLLPIAALAFVLIGGTALGIWLFQPTDEFPPAANSEQSGSAANETPTDTVAGAEEDPDPATEPEETEAEADTPTPTPAERRQAERKPTPQRVQTPTPRNTRRQTTTPRQRDTKPQTPPKKPPPTPRKVTLDDILKPKSSPD